MFLVSDLLGNDTASKLVPVLVESRLIVGSLPLIVLVMENNNFLPPSCCFWCLVVVVLVNHMLGPISRARTVLGE